MPFQPNYEVPEERKPYFLPANPDKGNGRVGCLVLHGFMGSPYSSRPMAEFLAKQGITMYCPLLPGHGHYPDKLYKVPHQAWIAEAEEALHTFRQKCHEIFIIGHSMGAVLGAHLATTAGKIKGLIMLTPIDDVPDKRLRLMRWLQYVMPWFYPHRSRSLRKVVRQRVLDFDPTIDFDDPEFQKNLLPRMSRLPTSGLAEMVKMVDKGRALWPKLHLPVLIFQGGNDPAVPPGSVERIYESIPSRDKILKTFAEAGHELMRPFEPVHTEVWQTIHEFIVRRATVETQTAVS
ncbi:MAG: alpha/beta fold hydrolase [Chloroflexi bacterium]|nr:MAG: alpha/beta fold hydrolase [Chloroflexota bacterium]